MASSRVVLRVFLLCSPLLIAATTLAADPASEKAELNRRFKGAEQAVVGTVTDVRPFFHRNQYGDELIVSRMSVRVSESLRGTAQSLVVMDVEGGTLNGLTLNVSDLPVLKRGDRGVFLLHKDPTGLNVPHGRGEGILLLSANDTVLGSSLTLGDVRRAAAAVR
jgi:hypothetical protein